MVLESRQGHLEGRELVTRLGATSFRHKLRSLGLKLHNLRVVESLLLHEGQDELLLLDLELELLSLRLDLLEGHLRIGRRRKLLRTGIDSFDRVNFEGAKKVLLYRLRVVSRSSHRRLFEGNRLLKLRRITHHVRVGHRDEGGRIPEKQLPPDRRVSEGN